jgi:hypothetical protein
MTTAPANQDGSAARLQRLFDDVSATPYRFDFYAVLRMAETAARDRPRLGRALRPRCVWARTPNSTSRQPQSRRSARAATACHVSDSASSACSGRADHCRCT